MGLKTAPSAPAEKVDNIEEMLTLTLADKRVRGFWAMQLSVFVSFIAYTAFLCCLPTIGGGGMFIKVVVNDDAAATPTSLYAVDAWFALGLTAAVDSISTVATFNRSVIDNWHYFVSVRMMALASIISFLVFLSGNPTLMAYDWRYKTAAVVACGLFYVAIGKLLDASHRLPARNAKPRYWHLQEYTTALNRAQGTWKSAVISTIVTGGLGTILTALIPPKWSTLIPVITTGFEAIFLRLNKFGRTPQYTVVAAPIFQAGVCVHWGLKQVAMAPKLALPSWLFIALVFVGRFALDLHLKTIWRPYPEFQWARKAACAPTTVLLYICAVLLLLEKVDTPIVQYTKPLGVLCCYFLSSIGVSAPAAYLIAFDKVRTKGKPDNSTVALESVKTSPPGSPPSKPAALPTVPATVSVN